MKTPHILAAVAIVIVIASASLSTAQAQGQANNTTGQTTKSGDDQVSAEELKRKFFQVSTSDGGAYMVALGHITSIAKHEYIVDGSVRVNEVSITATGSTITRFYYMEPVSDGGQSNAAQVILDRVKSTSKEIGKRTGTSGALNAVSKSYPHGTHTHNIEFRLKNKANVSQLYSALHNAWWNGQGTKVTVSTKQ